MAGHPSRGLFTHLGGGGESCNSDSSWKSLRELDGPARGGEGALFSFIPEDISIYDDKSMCSGRDEKRQSLSNYFSYESSGMKFEEL